MMEAARASPPLPLVVDAAERPASTRWWPWLLCLLGIDYFSTLAYQPSLTFEAVGLLGPLATGVVVLVTFAAALPVYWYVARHSPHGQGSIALLERLLHGWKGKLAILVLLGFAATDFVMLKTLSLADAAEHLTHDHHLAHEHRLQQWAAQLRTWGQSLLGQAVANYFTDQLIVTIFLGVLGFSFWLLLRKGFTRRVLFVAVPVVVLYLLFTGLVIGEGLWYLARHPQRLSAWLATVQQGRWQAGGSLGTSAPGWGRILLTAVLALPQLSLGLSGFEMSVILMPQVSGDSWSADVGVAPRGDLSGRIRNTRKLLLTAAALMAFYLLGSALVTALLIPAEEFGPQGAARHRALAYLAAGGRLAPGEGPDTLGPFAGPTFGLAYDLCTIVLLCLTGTSLMTTLGTLVPRFLLRFGMELQWVDRWGLLFAFFAVNNLLVTVYFQASVEAQRGAYAQGVLALFTYAAAAGFLLRLRRRPPAPQRRYYLRLGYAGLLLTLFAALLFDVLLRYPRGLPIVLLFVGTILITSIASRALRCDELGRTAHSFRFVDGQSRLLWETLCFDPFPVLVPHRPGREDCRTKEAQIRAHHQLDPQKAIVFLMVEKGDPSEFYQQLLIEVTREGDSNLYIIKVKECTSVPHAIAAVALALSRHSAPPHLHFGWPESNLLVASWEYLFFGEGSIPWKVRELIHRAEPDPARRPRVIVG